MRSSSRSCTRTCSPSTSCRRRRGSCSTGPPAAARPSSPRQWPTAWPRRSPRRWSAKARAARYFINIKGPELLNKYVGETERQIRLVFQRAREKSDEGWPVIVFFDEMDSMFRTRGSGISSDMESTIVPQLLAEIDGVEGLRNVIVIGATNREDLIDPAILRPGRLDVKIKIERPNADAARSDLRPSTSPTRSRSTTASNPWRTMIEATVGRDVPRRRGQPVPRGDLPERRQGDPLLQGLRLRVR